MRILALSDEECPALWDNYIPGRLAGYDLIISCGDLKPHYLSFLVTMAGVPLLYVHGNHDGRYTHEPPEGCECIDDALVTFNGLRILGLGGCLRYNPGPFQYTQKEMERRAARLHHSIRRAGGVDIVVAHAPPRGLGDQEDPAHQGFEALRDILTEFHPAFLLHGHVHLRYDFSLPREREFQGTRIINVSERFTLDLPDVPSPDRTSARVKYLRRPPRGQEDGDKDSILVK